MDVEQRARDALNEVFGKRGDCGNWLARDSRKDQPVLEAVCRLIEQQDAFRREVSDAVKGILDHDLVSVATKFNVRQHFSRFILPEPVDDITECLREAYGAATPTAATASNPH